jgi:rubrerythrin
MRLIDADALKHSIAGNIPLMPTVRIGIEHRIDDAPTIEAELVKHGRWTTENSFEWHCSECGYEPLVFENTPYCPNCGAKMGKEE